MECELTLSVSRVPARRFVYSLFDDLPLNWDTGLASVNTLVETIPTLSFANNKLVLSLLEHEDGRTMCKVGREVIGHYELDQSKYEGMGIADEPARECYKFSLGLVRPEGLTFNKFLEMEVELRKKTADFGEVEKEWRIMVDLSPSQAQKSLEISAEIQFFSLIKE